jgi:Bacterial dnaA protein helix-turn-helix
MYDGTGERKHYPRMSEIKEVVARHNGLTVADLESDCRKKSLAWPRQIAVYLCRKLTVYSYPQIGRAFGDRDHSTAIFSYRKVEHLCCTQRDLAEIIAAYETEIHAIALKRLEAEQKDALHYAPQPAINRPASTPWTPEERATLAELAKLNLPAKVIARSFPHRSIYAVKEARRVVRREMAEAVS